jgi:hypothetical protein
MRSSVFGKCLVVVLLAVSAFGQLNRPSSNSINGSFFGMSLQSSAASLPVPVLGASPTIKPCLYRIWDDHATFSELATARGTYTWTPLDDILNKVPAGCKFIYTFGPIPSFASSSSANDACHFAAGILGACRAPVDNNSQCTAQGSLNGQVFPNNCMVREFINDLLLHASANGTPITYVETGNETEACNGDAACDSTSFSSSDVMWVGSAADHEKMATAIAKQALATQPTIKITSPGMSGLGTDGTCNSSGNAWLNKWLLAGGSGIPLTYIAFHGYFNSAIGQTPETILSKITSLRACSLVASGPPLIDTEGGWGNGIMNGVPATTVSRVSGTVTAAVTGYPNAVYFTSGNIGQTIHVEGITAGSTSWNGDFTISAVPDVNHVSWTQALGDDCVSPCTVGTQQNQMILLANKDIQRDYVMRWHLLQFSQGIPIAVWYSYTNNVWGTLCVAYNSSVCLDNPVHTARTAYGEMYKWLADATSSGACSVNGTVYTCNYTKNDGYKSQAVWDTSGASTYTFPAGYTQYRLWDGTTALLSGTTQAIGTTPILLEKIPLNGRGR